MKFVDGEGGGNGAVTGQGVASVVVQEGIEVDLPLAGAYACPWNLYVTGPYSWQIRLHVLEACPCTWQLCVLASGACTELVRIQKQPVYLPLVPGPSPVRTQNQSVFRTSPYSEPVRIQNHSVPAHAFSACLWLGLVLSS